MLLARRGQQGLALCGPGAPKSERIGPKKTTEFPISYKPTEGRPAVGKLTVTDEAGTAVWVIYLSAAQ